MNPRLLAATAGLAALAGTAAPLLGQAAFVETFDDVGGPSYAVPQSLLQRGWVFRNQSQPVGSRTYYPGALPSTNPIYFNPQSGAGYLAVDGGTTDELSGGQMSAWALLPQVPNQRTGDTVTVWLRALSGESTVEVRYSPSAGTSTGSGPAAVGDYSQVLVSSSPVGTAGWVRYQAVVPGAGRLALRYSGTFGGLGNFNPYVGIDSLSVGAPPPPPCNLPPVPNPGQTVTWTASGGPYRVCQNIAVPPGATVNIEPGAAVVFDAGMQLAVSGTVNAGGTAAAPISLDAPGVFPPYIVVQGGTFNASFTDFGQQFRVSSGATITLADCTFFSNGTNLDGGMLLSDDIPSPQPYIRLERCLFSRSNMTLSGCLVTLRDNRFENSYALVLRGLADVIGGNDANGQPIRINRQDTTQPLLVDGVRATAVATGGGLQLEGGAYLLGPNNSLQGNRYALDLRGGLMPGSVVPVVGNTDNVINVFEAGFAGAGRWINAGIPYRITQLSGDLPGGDLEIEPGVVIEGLADTKLLVRSTRRVIAEGLPGAGGAITFRGVSGQHWQGLQFVTNGTSGPRLDYCTLTDGNLALVSSDNHLWVDNCLLANNVQAAGTGSGTIWFAKTLFQANQTGAAGRVRLLSPTNPNLFENNGVAVYGASELIEAANCWWNSPTGPRHPQNPGGTGDLIGGPSPSSVSIFPFLTARPDLANTPPVVRILEPGIHWNLAQNPFDYTAEPRTRFMLRWEAGDNAAIASQKILLSPDGHYPGRFTVTLAENLPADQRSIEIDVPEIGFAASNQPQFIKVVAVDAEGQEGWDQTPLSIPSGRLTGDLTITSDPAFVGRTFHAGDPFPNVTWTGSVSEFPTYDVFILMESDGASIAAITQGQSGQFFSAAPNVSTDRARIAVRARGNSNDAKWFFSSGSFSIRHDPRLGWQPPQVQLTGPGPGASFPGGGTVPIAWTASATQGLYGFDLQASTDGGRFWHLIARDLPASARAFNWVLPPSQGIADARVRVIARDLRFQNSSSEVTFAITPGSGPAPCYANCDGSTQPPILNVNDFVCFQSRFAAADPSADCNHDSTLNVNDFICFQAAFAAGCP